MRGHRCRHRLAQTSSSQVRCASYTAWHTDDTMGRDLTAIFTSSLVLLLCPGGSGVGWTATASDVYHFKSNNRAALMLTLLLCCRSTSRRCCVFCVPSVTAVDGTALLCYAALSLTNCSRFSVVGPDAFVPRTRIWPPVRAAPPRHRVVEGLPLTRRTRAGLPRMHRR